MACKEKEPIHLKGCMKLNYEISMLMYYMPFFSKSDVPPGKSLTVSVPQFPCLLHANSNICHIGF